MNLRAKLIYWDETADILRGPKATATAIKDRFARKRAEMVKGELRPARRAVIEFTENDRMHHVSEGPAL